MPPRTTVHYKIIAYDNAGNFAVSDKAGQYYVYTVVLEFSNWLLILLMLLAASLLAVSLSSRAKTERNP